MLHTGLKLLGYEYITYSAVYGDNMKTIMMVVVAGVGAGGCGGGGGGGGGEHPFIYAIVSL
jgi:hypothetical protein